MSEIRHQKKKKTLLFQTVCMISMLLLISQDFWTDVRAQYIKHLDLFTWAWFRPHWSGNRKASLSEHCIQQHSSTRSFVYNLKKRLWHKARARSTNEEQLRLKDIIPNLSVWQYNFKITDCLVKINIFINLT